MTPVDFLLSSEVIGYCRSSVLSSPSNWELAEHLSGLHEVAKDGRFGLSAGDIIVGSEFLTHLEVYMAQLCANDLRHFISSSCLSTIDL